jgi:glycine betaine/proline transport system substrate-binding protein
VACDYPPYNLNKIASAKFANSGTTGAELAKRFQWTNDDQNAVARAIAVDKKSPEDAAKEWVDANQDLVNSWLPHAT